MLRQCYGQNQQKGEESPKKQEASSTTLGRYSQLKRLIHMPFPVRPNSQMALT